MKYNVRASNVAFQPKLDKMTFGKNTFKYCSTQLWNLLLDDITKSTETSTFKSIKIWKEPR